MDLSIGSAREWFYRDDTSGSQRGPVPASVLCKLLEKGIGVSGTTIVWKEGMETWLPMASVAPFQSTIEFNTKQWYFLDHDRQQQGPIISRMLVHKMKHQEIDGMTLVFGGGLSEWKQVSEVPELKAEMIKINLEEQAAEEAAAAASSTTDEQQAIQYQTFVAGGTDDDIIPPYSIPVELNTATKTAGDGTKKSFIADNGIRYGWDDEEQDWVELDEDDLMEEEEEEEPEVHNTKANNNKNNKNNKKRKTFDENDSDHDENQDTEDNPSSSSATDVPAEGTTEGAAKKKRKKRKPKKAPNTWIYVSGLPKNVTFEEIKDHFSKVGLISLSPYDQQPYIKIYRDEVTGECKGDCSLCYNAEESVKTAVEFLHDGYIRPTHKITVKVADFSHAAAAATAVDHSNGGSGGVRKPNVSAAQRKVAKSAIQQALTWNDEEDVGIKRSAALRIVVLEGLFSPQDFIDDDQFETELEADIANECGKCGNIEKMTIFSKNPKGVVIVKFGTSFGAQECIKLMNGRYFGGRRIACMFWDGVTNHSLVPGSHSDKQYEAEEKQEKTRLDEFGDWLDQEQEELPEEFRLRTE